MPEDTPYTDRDKQYHYPTPIQQLATTLGHPVNTEHLRRLEDSVHTPLYYSALRPDSLPAHLQKPRLQFALEQLPLLTRYHGWYERRSIHVPARYTKCICGHAEEETWDHFKGYPLYRGLDTLIDWNPTHTIARHAGWLTRSPATQQLATILKQTEYSRPSAEDSSPQPSTPCYAPTQRTPRPRLRTCNGRPLPRQRSNSHTAPTNTSTMQQPCPKQTKPTSSNSCSTNHENLPHDKPTRDPNHTYTPSTGHNTGTARTGTTGTAHKPTRMRAPPAPISPRHRPSTGTTNRKPPQAPSAHASGYHRRPCPATQTTGSAWEPRTASATAPTAGSSTPTIARSPRPQPHPPPPGHPSFLGPLNDTLRDHLGGYYLADAADHAWTIAVATGSTPLHLHSPPLRHSGGGLNVAARHVLLALYLHHRDLHLPAPQAAAPIPEAWADIAPEEIAAYLRITCRRFNTVLGRQRGTPYPLSALLYPAHHPHPTQLRPPEGWASFRDAHRAGDGPHGQARLRQSPRGAPLRGAPLARPLPVAPAGTGGFTRP